MQIIIFGFFTSYTKIFVLFADSIKRTNFHTTMCYWRGCHLVNAHPVVVFAAVVVGAIMVRRSECVARTCFFESALDAHSPLSTRIHPPLFLPCPRVHFNDQQTASPTLFLLTRNSAISRRRDKLWVPLWLARRWRQRTKYIYRSNKICIAREQTQYK
jgi:hypothetical protein